MKHRARPTNRLVTLLILAILWRATPLWPQLAAPNEAGVTMGHLHLNLRGDVLEAHKKLWVALGGTLTSMGAFEVVKFPGVLVFLNFPQAEPASGGNAGTVVDHVGLRVRNLKESLTQWKRAGLKTASGKSRSQAYVFAPDDIRIEIVEDRSLAVPIASDHIHFVVGGRASAKEIAAWYVRMFGAKPGIRGPDETDTLPGVNLTFSKTAAATVGTKGRTLDHIGFEIKDLEAFCKKLEASGVKFDVPYRKASGLGLAFLTDPWGTYIELNEGLDRL